MRVALLPHILTGLYWIIVVASGQSPTTISSKYSAYNLTQLVDHTNNASGTYNQRYQLVTEYFKPGGPILFTQSAENTLAPIEDGNTMDMAYELGAIVANLEHRYFGTSVPESFDGSLASFEPLTLENVREDAVQFIQFLKRTIPGAAQSPVVVTGGSYGGNLCINFRVKRPDIFWACMASSPETASFGPLANNTHKFDASRWLSNVYYDLSAETSAKIKSAMATFNTCANVGHNCTEAIPEMNWCGSTPNASEFSMIFQAAMSSYTYAAQFDYPNVVGAYPVANPLQFIMNATTTATTAAEVLQIPIALWAQQGAQQADIAACIDWNSLTAGPAIIDAWNYIQCQYFPNSDLIAFPPGNLFPAMFVDSRNEPCGNPAYQSSMYNSTNEWWQNYLGTTTEILDSTTRLLIIQGSLDGATGAGVPPLTLSDDRQHSRVILVSGTAHVEDQFSFYHEPRGVRPSLDAVRDTKLEYIKEWLGWYAATSL